LLQEKSMRSSSRSVSQSSLVQVPVVTHSWYCDRRRAAA
jgi:hypothetical protein